MSIATEQKVEQLLTRVEDLEKEVAELRQIIESAKNPVKEATSGRLTLKK